MSLGTVSHAHGKHLGFRRHVRPQHRATAEHVKEPLRRRPPVQNRKAAGPRRIEDRGVAILRAHAQQLAGDLTQRLLPGDALEGAAAARPRAAQGILQAVGVINAFYLAHAAGAGVQRRQFGLPPARVGGDLDYAPVDDVRIHHAAAPAVVAASAGNHALAKLGLDPRSLVDRRPLHSVSLGC
jgi:hypothetical protein